MPRIIIRLLGVLIITAGLVQAEKPTHPFLFFRQTDLPLIKAGIASIPWSQDAFKKVKKQVDAHKKYVLPEPHDAVRDGWMRANSRNCQTAVNAAFLYQVTGEERYLAKAREFLTLYADSFEQRINMWQLNDRDGIMIYHIGTLGTKSAWVYDMVCNALSMDERKKIEHGFLRKVVTMVQQTTEHESIFDAWAGAGKKMAEMPKAKDYSWGPGQWNGVLYCNTGITAIGFVLQDSSIYGHGIANWKVYLARDMLADGFWFDEDFEYSRFCFSSMLAVAEMAYQSGYNEDLYTLAVPTAPQGPWWGKTYADTVHSEGNSGTTRSLRMYLDAQIDYQYPDRSAGNWGWQMNDADMFRSGTDAMFYELGYRHYQDPGYGWILSRMDRSRGNEFICGQTSPMLYTAVVDTATPPPVTASRWYNHNQWLVLKSIEGRDYWGSDALYAFMPYGAERSKAIQRLSVDVFGFGKVIAPRLSKVSRLQAHDKDYYLNDDSWNNLMVDDENLSGIKGKITNAGMRFHEFSPEIKIGQAQLDYERRVRPSIWYDEVIEKRPDLDFTESRALGLTDVYLVDITTVRYKEPQKYKHNFYWNWHAFGELKLEGVQDGENTSSPWTATWQDTDRVGIRTIMLPGSGENSTKVVCRKNQFTSYLRAMRGNFNETFVAVHEPFRGAPAIDSISQVYQDSTGVVLRIEDRGNFIDYVCVAFAADSLRVAQPDVAIDVLGNYGYMRAKGDTLTCRGGVESFTLKSGQVKKVMVNGRSVKCKIKDGVVMYGVKK
jgi:hypothetical protein